MERIEMLEHSGETRIAIRSKVRFGTYVMFSLAAAFVILPATTFLRMPIQNRQDAFACAALSLFFAAGFLFFLYLGFFTFKSIFEIRIAKDSIALRRIFLRPQKESIFARPEIRDLGIHETVMGKVIGFSRADGAFVFLTPPLTPEEANRLLPAFSSFRGVTA